MDKTEGGFNIDEQVINDMRWSLYTKRDILNESVGEIKSLFHGRGNGPGSGFLYSPQNGDNEYNTIFNRMYFDVNQKKLSEGKYTNMAHIFLSMPIVNPIAFDLKSNNHLRYIINADRGETIKDLAYYNSFLVIPKYKRNQNTAEISKEPQTSNTQNSTALGEISIKSPAGGGFYTTDELKSILAKTKSNNSVKKSQKRDDIPIFMGDTEKYEKAFEKALGNPSLIRELNVKYFSKNDDEPVLYKRKYYVVSYDIFKAESTIDPCLGNGNKDIWSNNFYILTGAYAIAYLLGRIDVESELRYGEEWLKNSDNLGISKTAKESVKQHLSTLRNFIKHNELIDVVTDVIPVIPPAYRDHRITEKNGEKKDDRDQFNNLYSSILYIENNLLKSDDIKRLEPIPYELFFNVLRRITILEREEKENGKLSETDAVLKKKLQASLDNALNTLPFTPTLGCADAVINAYKKIQKDLYKYIIGETSQAEGANKSPSQQQKIGGKHGQIREDGLAKRCDDSARTVITSDPELELDYIGIPYDILVVSQYS